MHLNHVTVNVNNMSVEEYDKLLSGARTEAEKLDIFLIMSSDDDVDFMEMNDLMNKYPR